MSTEAHSTDLVDQYRGRVHQVLNAIEDMVGDLRGEVVGVVDATLTANRNADLGEITSLLLTLDTLERAVEAVR